MKKGFCQASENNKAPILACLTEHFSRCSKILEIGSGTGQHAAHFAPALPHLIWQTSDFAHNHETILAWMEDTAADNLLPPAKFVIGIDEWQFEDIDGVFTANTAHIMQPSQVRQMMQIISENLPTNGVFCQYGPFNVDGQYTSEGNRQFDRHLKGEGCGGIRDIKELQDWTMGLELTNTLAMPANNFLLVWRKP